MTKQYAILGTGAIGGYVAIKLCQVGFLVHCLLRSDFLYVKQQGLTLTTDEEKITLPINAYQNAEEMPVCDVIIVTLKTTENVLLKEMLPKIMHKNTNVILLQNGIGIEQEIAEIVDATKIIGGNCIIKVCKTGPGVIRHFGFNSIELAQYYADPFEEGITPSVEALANDFRKANIDCITERHLPTMRWKKLATNIDVNGLSVVLNASIQELILNPISFKLLCDITKEVISVAEQCGAKLPKDLYQFRMNILESFKSMSRTDTSMKKDFDTKRPLELHAIYENAIFIAKQSGISMPLTEMLYLNEKNLSDDK